MQAGGEDRKEYSTRWDFAVSTTRNMLSVFLEVYHGNLNEPGIGTECLEIALESRHFSAALVLSQANVSVEYIDLCLSYINLPLDYCQRKNRITISEQENLYQFLLTMFTKTGDRVFLDHALQLSVCRRDLHHIKELVLRGADINAEAWPDGGNALQLALYLCPLNKRDKTSMESLKYILQIGANVNDAPFSSLEYLNSFQYAATLDTEVFSLLLHYEPDINAPAPDYRGKTALQAATGSHTLYMENIHMLLERGADINAAPASSHGITALQGAAIMGYMKVALILLEKGADPNAAGAEEGGRTALEGAAEQGHLDMVQLLLNAGARPSESAAYLAEEEEHFAIADLIRDNLTSEEAEEVSQDLDESVYGEDSDGFESWESDQS